MRTANAMMRIGIISDTHGLLRPEAIKHLAGTDHIIHAGDIGAPEVIDGLRRIAPTTAIRGNIDAGEWAKDYPDTELIALGGRVLYVLHNLKGIELDPAAAGIEIVVSGHSHRPNVVTKNVFKIARDAFSRPWRAANCARRAVSAGLGLRPSVRR